MFAKIFVQIFDSSIVEDPEVRFTFMDLLILSDANGIVDMTHEAIARRTNRPIDVIRKTIAILESSDTRSRTRDHEGRRIKRIDDHRDWGWFIVNYESFRNIASEEQRKEKTLNRVKKFRQKSENTSCDVTPCNAPVTPCNAEKKSVTHVNACNAMQRQKQKKDINYNDEPLPETPPMKERDFFAMAEMRGILKECAQWFWNDCDGRNWLDKSGQPIRKVEPLLLNCWNNWKINQAAKNKKSQPPPRDANHPGMF